MNNYVLKKIEMMIKNIKCEHTKEDLYYLYNNLKNLHTPSIKWIIK
jgi:hypothetical protein